MIYKLLNLVLRRENTIIDNNTEEGYIDECLSIYEDRLIIGSASTWSRLFNKFITNEVVWYIVDDFTYKPNSNFKFKIRTKSHESRITLYSENIKVEVIYHLPDGYPYPMRININNESFGLEFGRKNRIMVIDNNLDGYKKLVNRLDKLIGRIHSGKIKINKNKKINTR